MSSAEELSCILDELNCKIRECRRSIDEDRVKLGTCFDLLRDAYRGWCGQDVCVSSNSLDRDQGEDSVDNQKVSNDNKDVFQHQILNFEDNHAFRESIQLKDRKIEELVEQVKELELVNSETQKSAQEYFAAERSKMEKQIEKYRDMLFAKHEELKWYTMRISRKNDSGKLDSILNA